MFSVLVAAPLWVAASMLLLSLQWCVVAHTIAVVLLELALTLALSTARSPQQAGAWLHLGLADPRLLPPRVGAPPSSSPRACLR